jgi:hypothetical protein
VNASLSLVQTLDDDHLGGQINALGSQRQGFTYSASCIAEDTAKGPDLPGRFSRSAQKSFPLVFREVEPFPLCIDDLHNDTKIGGFVGLVISEALFYY